MQTKIFTFLLLTCLKVKAQADLKNPEDEDCICVPIGQCGFANPVEILIRQIDGCENRLDICCTEDNIIHVIPPNPPPGTCGNRNPRGLHFEIKDADLESQYAEFPWMIEISVETNKNLFNKPVYSYIAGGSLITPSSVLTAAHKMRNRDATQLRVRAGEWERNSINEPYLHQDRKVSEIITHEDYNPTHGFNAIAILILESAIILQGHINTICLPPKNYDFTGSQCYVTGWGMDARDDDMIRKPVHLLKKIDLPVISRRVCQHQLQQTRLGSTFQLNANFMCAGGEKDKDACFGDGGSPLVCPIPNTVNRYYLAGIVIGGINCGNNEVPGIYIEVSKFIDWINLHKNLKFNGILHIN